MLLNYLKPMAVFAQVVEMGSFTAAGKQLGLPRGKVSDQVSRLERYTGTRLLTRSTRSVKVTAEGEALYHYAKHILQNGNQGLSELNSFNEQIKGKIRISTTDDFYDCLLLPILKQFCQRYPEVQLDMLITKEPLSVIDDSIDLAIRSGELADSNLISVPLTRTKLKLYGAINQSYPLQHPSDLQQVHWIALGNNSAEKAISLYKSENSKFELIPRYQHFANSISSYRQLIEQGFGIGLIAEHTAQELVKKGTLQPILEDWYNQELTISLLYPHRLNMARRTRLLINEIRAAFGS